MANQKDDSSLYQINYLSVLYYKLLEKKMFEGYKNDFDLFFLNRSL